MSKWRREWCLHLIVLSCLGVTLTAQKGRVRAPDIESFSRERVYGRDIAGITNNSLDTASRVRSQLTGKSLELAEASRRALAGVQIDLVRLLIDQGASGGGLSAKARQDIDFQTALKRFELAELRMLEASGGSPNATIAEHVRRLAVEFAKNRDTAALTALTAVLDDAGNVLRLIKEASPQQAFEGAAYRLFIRREPDVGKAMEIASEVERHEALSKVMTPERRRKWLELFNCVLGQ
jgi:hypothetical protein